MLRKDKKILETLTNRYGIKHINEALRESDSGIKTMLEFFANSYSGVGAALYRQKVIDANSVDIVSLSEVFSPEEIKVIKKYIRPKAKMCYKNAYMLCDYFDGDGHDVRYVEGYLNMRGLPIEHAFNYVDGKYVDITMELALGKDMEEDSYISIGEFSTDEVRKVLLKNGYYGQIYETLFLERYNER